MVAIALGLPVAARAQLQIFTVPTPAEERPAAGLLPMGTIPTGEPLDVLIRIRNSGQSMAVVETLSVSGTGFSLVFAPTIPRGLVAGTSLDFYVRYVSDAPTSDARGTLRINTVSISLIAAATAAPSLFQIEEDGSRTRRQHGTTTVFPPVEQGQRSVRRFTLLNPHDRPLTVSNFSITGDSFRLASTIISPFSLGPSQSLDFEIGFEPSATGLRLGSLAIEGRSVRLEGIGRAAILPRPSIHFSSETLQSGKQVPIEVRFDSEARAEGAGILRMEFEPALLGPDDPAVAFVSGSRTSIPFVVRPGQTQGLFSGQKETLLQTGTTAGTLRLTAEMGGFRTEATVRIVPAPVTLSTVSARRGVERMELTLTGFDNTRSATEIAFSFYDSAGQPIAPGVLRADAASAFRQYFAGTKTGGSFQLMASFPANTSTTAVAAVEIEIRNSAGTTRTDRTSF
jgi:hypothetical protein